MTSHVLSIGSALSHAWRRLVVNTAFVFAWAFYPTPDAAAARFKRRPRDVADFLLILAILVSFTNPVSSPSLLLAVTMTLIVAQLALLVIQRTKWHAGRVEDFKAACATDASEDFALSPEERSAVYDALRINRTVLRRAHQRDKLLALVADNLCADIAHAPTHKDVGFLANLGNVVMPTGCVWRMHIQQAAGVARSRLYDAEVSRHCPGDSTSKG